MNRLLIGIGGAGNNTVNNIIEDNQLQIDTLVINSDKGGIEGSLSKNKIYLDTEKYKSIEKAFKNITIELSAIIERYTYIYIGKSCRSKLLNTIQKEAHKILLLPDVSSNPRLR